MKLNNLIKYVIRFTFLQSVLTITTIYYFDNFLISNNAFKQIIYINLVEDIQRFLPFINANSVSVDAVLVLLVNWYQIAFGHLPDHNLLGRCGEAQR